MKYTALIPLVLCAPLAQADWYWAPYTETASHHGHGRGAKQFVLHNATTEQQPDVELIHSDLVRETHRLDGNRLKLRPTGKNNYHLLLATAKGQRYEYAAARYLYFNGRPVDTSPTDLLAAPQASLVLIPDPLPREHWKYESQKSYWYRATFNGAPLANQPVLATTTFGSTEILHTDAFGVLEVHIPDDFPEVVPAKRATPPGELKLFISLERGGVDYQFSLSSRYHASAKHWKSASAGALVLGLGMFAGFVVNRRLPSHDRRRSKVK